MTVDEMSAFNKTLTLISNRVKVVNQVLGYGCYGRGVPCRYTYVHGTHEVNFCGSVFSRFGPYDQKGADLALTRLDALFDTLWYGIGAGVVCLA